MKKLELTSRQMNALHIAEKEKKEGIWAYKLHAKYHWKSLSTAASDLKKLEKLGFLQQEELGKRERRTYKLVPGLFIASKATPVDLPIKTITISCKDASQVSVVVKPLATVPGTVLYYMGSAAVYAEGSNDPFQI